MSSTIALKTSLKSKHRLFWTGVGTYIGLHTAPITLFAVASSSRVPGIRPLIAKSTFVLLPILAGSSTGYLVGEWNGLAFDYSP